MRSDQQKTLEHTIAHANGDWKMETIARNLKNNFNVSVSLGFVASYSEANAIVTWYRDNDLNLFRAWCRTAATAMERLLRLGEEIFPPYPMYLELRWALLSNDYEIVDNMTNIIDHAMPEKKKVDPKFEEYFVSTAIHAWRAEWEIVKARCERALEARPVLPKQKRYTLDYEFYLGLAQNDIVKMQAAIKEMLEPRELKKNENFETGYNVKLFSSRAIICLKLAWFHSMQVEVESHLISEELLRWEKQEKVLLVDFI